MGSRIWAFHWYQNRWPWMILNGVISLHVIVLNVLAFKANCMKLVKLDPYSLQQKCSPKDVVFGNVSFTVIISEITPTEIYCTTQKYPHSTAKIHLCNTAQPSQQWLSEGPIHHGPLQPNYWEGLDPRTLTGLTPVTKQHKLVITDHWPAHLVQ